MKNTETINGIWCEQNQITGLCGFIFGFIVLGVPARQWFLDAAQP